MSDKDECILTIKLVFEKLIRVNRKRKQHVDPFFFESTLQINEQNHYFLPMKRTIIIATALAVSFCCGFAMNSIFSRKMEINGLKRVTGIGGIFFKCKDPEKLKTWYHDHLGLNTDTYGTNFVWYQGADSTKHGYTQWTPFKETTKYFEPSKSDFMINYRVADLSALITALKNEGVTVCDTVETYNYGKFVHILDNEGNKVELWEPNDSEYGKFDGGKTK